MEFPDADLVHGKVKGGTILSVVVHAVALCGGTEGRTADDHDDVHTSVTKNSTPDKRSSLGMASPASDVNKDSRIKAKARTKD